MKSQRQLQALIGVLDSVRTQVHRFVKSSDEHFNLSVDMLSAHTHPRFQTTTARCFYHR